MATTTSAATLVLIGFGLLSSGLVEGRRAQATTASADPSGEVWVEPRDLESRDLFLGPADGPPPPMENGSFAFVQKDTSGRSPGYDVLDRAGVVWSVKLGPEAQAEVVSSRLLWAIGFHQPPTYHLNSWRLTGGPEPGPQTGGRFRPEVQQWKVAAGAWEFEKYPHAATVANAGLLVAQMMINNWDLKDSNNKLIERPGATPPRLYIVRDLGASLGSNEQTKWLRWTQLRFQQGTKNDIEGFEESGFIDGVDDGYVKFSYSGPNKELVSRISPAHVRWTSRLFSRLSDKQWGDAFRAGGYPPADAARYIATFKAKIAQGLALQ